MPARPTVDAPPRPREIQLEVTAACNLRCRMCLVRYRPPVNRVAGSMSFETFRTVVDDLPELERVTLQGLGEPLLNPDLVAMVRYASARGIRVGFNTNGLLLTPERAEDLVAAGVDWLHVSVDGARRDTYAYIRGRDERERVARNVASLVAVKRRLGMDRPRLSIVFVAMRENFDELPDLVRDTAAWGVPTLRVQNLAHDFSDTDPDGDYAAIRAFTSSQALWAGDAHVRDTFDEARAVAEIVGVDLRLPEVEEPPAPRAEGTPGCGWPWTSAYLTHDARVQPCCMVMGADRAVLGEVHGPGGFERVWRSAPYDEFRAALLGDTPPEVCRGCSMYRGVF
ncbi:MAG: radical SAM protein [Actinobacteria bacterium]|nr:radical SAM protein [Actinomycetota bacterium]